MRVYGLLLILEKKFLVQSKPVQIITLEFIAFMYMIFLYIYIIWNYQHYLSLNTCAITLLYKVKLVHSLKNPYSMAVYYDIYIYY